MTSKFLYNRHQSIPVYKFCVCVTIPNREQPTRPTNSLRQRRAIYYINDSLIGYFFIFHCYKTFLRFTQLINLFHNFKITAIQSYLKRLYTL